MGDGISPGGKVEHRQPKDPYDNRSIKMKISKKLKKK